MRPGFISSVFIVALTVAPPRAAQTPQVSGETQTNSFVCGKDQTLPGQIELRWTTVVLAGDGRFYSPCDGLQLGPFVVDRPQAAIDHREVREADLIARGLAVRDKEIHWRSAQAIVRGASGLVMVGEVRHTAYVVPACSAQIQVFGGLSDLRRWQPGQLFRLLVDEDAEVRREAAYAIGTRLAEATERDADVVKGALEELRVCFGREAQPDIKAMILEDLGMARYGTDIDRTAAEKFIFEYAKGSKVLVLGGMRGLDALFKQNPDRPALKATVERLKQIATSEAVDAAGQQFAVMALQTSGDLDTLTIWRIAQRRDNGLIRILAGRLNLNDSEQARFASTLELDNVPSVMLDLLSSYAHHAATTKICAPIVRHLKDTSDFVRMQAMDLLLPSCTDLDETVPKLIDMAASLEKTESHQQWHLPARAMASLARIRPDEAKPLLPLAIKHPAWQVRAMAAAASVPLRDESVALALARDDEPNVRTAVLSALFQLRSAQTVPESIKVLTDEGDYQVLRMAAYTLKGLSDEQKEDATKALLIALKKLTAQETDTSRDTRVAIIERLAETMTPEHAADLLPFTADLDDDVIAAARKTYATVNSSPAPQIPLRRRYPFQPAEAALASPAVGAVIDWDKGVIVILFQPKVAPVTVARFTATALAGYYDGTTFHKVVPFSYLLAGSPGANDFSGVPRFIRDETGPQARHSTYLVGMSNHGRDSGDGQFFIDLAEQPAFDRKFTIFASVCNVVGAPLTELLEGARISRVSIVKGILPCG